MEATDNNNNSFMSLSTTTAISKDYPVDFTTASKPRRRKHQSAQKIIIPPEFLIATLSPVEQARHITIWNPKERRKVAGNAAPTLRNLHNYLRKNPDFQVYDEQETVCDDLNDPNIVIHPVTGRISVRNCDHVAVWHKADRRKVTGNAAPLRKNLDTYLAKHPEYELYTDQDKQHQKEDHQDGLPPSPQHDGHAKKTNGSRNPITTKVEIPSAQPNVEDTADGADADTDTDAAASGLGNPITTMPPDLETNIADSLPALTRGDDEYDIVETMSGNITWQVRNHTTGSGPMTNSHIQPSVSTSAVPSPFSPLPAYSDSDYQSPFTNIHLSSFCNTDPVDEETRASVANVSSQPWHAPAHDRIGRYPLQTGAGGRSSQIIRTASSAVGETVHPAPSASTDRDPSARVSASASMSSPAAANGESIDMFGRISQPIRIAVPRAKVKRSIPETTVAESSLDNNSVGKISAQASAEDTCHLLDDWTARPEFKDLAASQDVLIVRGLSSGSRDWSMSRPGTYVGSMCDRDTMDISAGVESIAASFKSLGLEFTPSSVSLMMNYVSGVMHMEQNPDDAIISPSNFLVSNPVSPR